MIQANSIDISIYQKEKKGNYYCGDSYYYYQNNDFFLCALADGLGSGSLAHESSQAVMNVIKSNPTLPVDKMIRRFSQALTGKRGVVLGILKLDFKKKAYHYTSVGNIGLLTISANGIKKRNIPTSGYLGSCPRGLKEISGQLTKEMLFVLFSDGVLSKELTHHIFNDHNPAHITDIFEDEMEQNRDDDTTLIVIKHS